MTLGSLSIPSWETTILAQETSKGQLSGIPAGIIGAIDQAESSGTGGAINSKGYGGYFGLGESTTYPGGTTTPALLQGTTPAAFAAQSQIAASEFASLLPTVGGTVFKAEQTYQTGSPTGFGEGDQIMAQVFGTTIPPITNASPASKATLTGWLTTVRTAIAPGSSFFHNMLGLPAGTPALTAAGGVAKKAVSKGASAVGAASLTSWGPFLSKALLVMGGIGLIVMGAWGVAKRPAEGAAHAAGDVAKVGALA